jgi:hypothetical protein
MQKGQGMNQLPMRGLIFSALTFILLIFGAASAGAADIWISDNPKQNLILEGTITSGDYDKLRKLIDENCPGKWTVQCPHLILLASPGGSLLEAMKIGRLIRKLRLDTIVLPKLRPDHRQGLACRNQVERRPKRLDVR